MQCADALHDAGRHEKNRVLRLVKALPVNIVTDLQRRLKPVSLSDATYVVIEETLPNQELSVMYGEPTLNYGDQLPLYVPYMLRVSMTVTGDLAHLQLSDLQSETRPICRTSDLQGERMLICRT